VLRWLIGATQYATRWRSQRWGLQHCASHQEKCVDGMEAAHAFRLSFATAALSPGEYRPAKETIACAARTKSNAG
jgi:hypothetical protein